MKGVLQRTACVLVLASAACAPRAAVQEASLPEPHANHGPAEQTAAPAAHPADVKFMQDMIGHHAQALVMVDMVPGRTTTDEILKLAEKIDISQRDEIGMMQDWLRERGQPLPDEHHAHHTHMPGMLTEAQLEELRAARGAVFDRLFLTFMIRHHQGALTMVDELFASPGAAQDSDVFRFVTDVATDQQDEIDVMIFVLQTLTSSGSSNR